MKYRKKPVVIDAVEFNGLNHDEIACFCEPKPVKVGGGFTLLIPTLEGEMTASKGDWIIKGRMGEFYPCKPHIFADTYELDGAGAVDEMLSFIREQVEIWDAAGDGGFPLYENGKAILSRYGK